MLKAGRRRAWVPVGLVVLFAVITAAGCSTGGSIRPSGASTGDPATDAAAILGRYKSTPAADASLAVRIKPAKGDALNIQLHIWCAADGRVRINASKLDLDFCSALLRPDGSYIVIAPRAHLAATGTFDDQDRANLTPLFTQPGLIADELRSGPLPPHGAWQEGHPEEPDRSTLFFQLPPHLTADATWDTRSGLVTIKELICSNPDSRDVIDVVYSHERDFDGLLRPTLANVTVATMVGSNVIQAPTPESLKASDPTNITIGLRSFDGLGEISAERMHLDVPADARTVPLDELLKHLGD